MKQYTVLLLYPDFMADNYGEDTYLAYVEADDVQMATRKAQVEALRAQGRVPGLTADAFMVLFICEGHHANLTWSSS